MNTYCLSSFKIDVWIGKRMWVFFRQHRLVSYTSLKTIKISSWHIKGRNRVVTIDKVIEISIAVLVLLYPYTLIMCLWHVSLPAALGQSCGGWWVSMWAGGKWKWLQLLPHSMSVIFPSSLLTYWEAQTCSWILSREAFGSGSIHHIQSLDIFSHSQARMIRCVYLIHTCAVRTCYSWLLAKDAVRCTMAEKCFLTKIRITTRAWPILAYHRYLHLLICYQ